MVRRYALAGAALVIAAAACKAFGASGDDDGASSPQAQPAPSGPIEGGVIREGGVLVPPPPPPPEPTSESVDGGGGLLPANAFLDVKYERLDDFERPDPWTGGPFVWVRSGDVGQAACDKAGCAGKFGISFWLHQAQDPVIHADIRGDAKILRIGASIRIEPYQGTDFHAQILSVGLSKGRNIYFEVNRARLRLGDQFLKPDDQYDNDDIELGPLVENVWARYHLYIDLEKNLAGVARNGVLYAVKKIRPQVTEAPLVAERVRLGAAYDDKKRHLNMFFDDVGVLEEPVVP